jgi:hypothetical protein
MLIDVSLTSHFIKMAICLVFEPKYLSRWFVLILTNESGHDTD